jgi:hypothetical protein
MPEDRAGDVHSPAPSDARDGPDDGSLPNGAPAGWVALGGISPKCRIAISPDRSHANPPPDWTPCGDGCLEFSVPSPNIWTGIKHASGAARRGTRYIAFDRYSGPPSERVELQIVRIPENTVTFDGILDDVNHDCTFLIDSVSPDTVLLEGYVQADATGNLNRFFRFVMKPEESTPRLIFDRTDSVLYETRTASAALWAASYARGWAMQWSPLTFANDANVGWMSPDGRAIISAQAVGATVLAGTALAGSSYAIMLWNPTDGAKPLVQYDSIQQGGACCVHSDETDMVWFEGGGWAAGSPETFSDLWLMTSPLVTNPKDLQPRKLHRAYQNFLVGGTVVVGGGYALASERRVGESASRLVLTRLSDGAFVSVLPPAGFVWVYPLYVDDTELAAFQKPQDGPQSFQKPLSIVRHSLSTLGPFQSPDAGF